MLKSPSSLPPRIGEWLASGKPELLEKAEVALQAAEPDANNLLLERAKKGRNDASVYVSLAFVFPFMVYFLLCEIIASSGHPPHDTFSRLCYTLLPFLLTPFVAFPLMAGFTNFFALPLQARAKAISFALVRRGDVRAVPLLLDGWFDHADDLPEIEAALIALTRNAAPGTIPFSENLLSKDSVAPVRAKFAKMTAQGKRRGVFTKSATLNARRVEVWLTLLPHLAADPNPKSQAVLAGILDAQARTLEEELLQNTVRALLTPSANADAVNEATADTQFGAWKPLETNEAPTVLQRRR